MRTNQEKRNRNFFVIKRTANSEKVLIETTPLMKYLRLFVNDNCNIEIGLIDLIKNLPEVPNNIPVEEQLSLMKVRFYFAEIIGEILVGLRNGLIYQIEQKKTRARS